jgi:hypothetical protein
MELDFSAVRQEALYQVWRRARSHMAGGSNRRVVFRARLYTGDQLGAMLARNLTPAELLSAFPAVCVLR